ncbi:hypothetical protein [Streptomyces sp. NBC_01643]|uniref:hypothetical protein n=1 Tax=Streptomyces sp. NBC_01643 TaxID=2975906 RepID=UPI002F916C89|nr:hypothetical protein OHB03_46300 [Streptomyces sp. NBC_01643]WTD39922.1 hypothetical protein OHB03_49850 [Streptomyces sp. NBC_01643]
MSLTAADFVWLPDYQLHVAATLAHVDQTVDRVVRLVHDYTAQGGPLSLETVADCDRAHVVVSAVAPLPEAITRLVADALTQLRAALEHTVYAEAENGLGRPLAAEEARSIEMPAATTPADFDKWLNHGRRRLLPPLQNGAPLAERIRTLQPFQRRVPDEHPLKLLVEYTNLAKHRMPAVAAARLGAVYPDTPHPGLAVSQPLERRPQPGSGRPLAAGDVIATGPRDAYIPISIMTTVSLQRPHTEVWNIAVKELEYLEDWVRTTAVPLLIAGSRDVTPLPPQLDIETGHHDPRSELPRSGTVSAAERGAQRIQAAVGRTSLVEVLAPLVGGDMSDTISAWVSTLNDDAVRERVHYLIRAGASPQDTVRVTNQLFDEIRAYEARCHEPDGG